LLPFAQRKLFQKAVRADNQHGGSRFKSTRPLMPMMVSPTCMSRRCHRPRLFPLLFGWL
jgi:hypothetical protein